ncbi:MAG: ExeM/NucH family extracellular endonuclease [Candidatus Promineifilaceae bacterium]|nr:ExeM/NucH family extracellular endonuclease [Candidatus Promineifilaceae bacterium]
MNPRTRALPLLFMALVLAFAAVTITVATGSAFALDLETAQQEAVARSGPLEVTPDPPVINEFVFNHTGSDTEAFIEVEGTAGSDYSTYTVLEIEGDDNPGNIDAVLPLTSTNAQGYWVSPEDAENDTVTLLLVKNFVGTVDTDLDTNDDGMLDLMLWESVADNIAVDGGGTTYGGVTLAPGFDGVSFSVGGASRIPDGVDTDSPDDWVRNDFDGAGFAGMSGTPAVGEAYNTPGAENEIVEAVDVGACGDPATLISAIQGSDPTSPLEGQTGIIIEGVVVGDFQDEDGDLFDTDLGGFFVQEEPSDYDGDPATSEGIFVDTPGGAADVEAGDIVRLAGTVDERTTFGGASMTQIQLSGDLLDCGAGTTPAPINLILPVTDTVVFERHEGMLVRFPQRLVISEYYNFDRFNEVVLTEPFAASRPFQPTAYIDPDAPGDAITDAVDLLDRSRITVDDARTVQNPDLLRHPAGGVFTLTHRFRGGDLVRDATGVVEHTFGRYRLHPTAVASYTAENLRTEAPEDVGGLVQVAAFNVLNYFLTIDDGSDICGPDLNFGCRGADTPEEFARQKAKILAALEAIDADVYGLVELENTTGVYPTADLVASLNASMGAGTYATVYTGTVGTDAIKVGIIYKPSVVTPIGDVAILDEPAFTNPRNLDTPKNRAALAHSFMVNETGETFTVIVNHLKSKGSPCGPGDDDPFQGNCNETRRLAADYLVDWLAGEPTGVAGDENLIIGDLNAYDKEDPIDEIIEGPDDILGTADDYADLLFELEGEFAYTYVFDGQFGYLDYAMASTALLDEVTGADVWHINADEPDVLSYDTSFKGPGQEALYEENAYRSSDHDPVIVGLFPHYKLYMPIIFRSTAP